jgi:transcriptional regulator with XRE-family HTH domain
MRHVIFYDMKTKTYKNIVGENIRSIRQARQLTQEELALMSGLSQGYINQLESGKRRFTEKSLCAIAEGLELPLYVFFKEEGREQQHPGIVEKPEAYTKRPPAREVLNMLKALPPHIADHYMTLLSIEKNLYPKKKG